MVAAQLDVAPLRRRWLRRGALLHDIGKLGVSLAPVAAPHHERLDGKGYPKDLPGRRSPSRRAMLIVADIFAALTAERPYRGALSVTRALEIMRADTGTAIDPLCFAALVASVPEMQVQAPGALRPCWLAVAPAREGATGPTAPLT